MSAHPEVERFIAVMERLRRECPWDAEQTHHSLVTYLVEETAETVEAIETDSDTDLREELGDLLLQVIFHSTIAAERGAFTLEDVAAGVADKLVDRHPYVFADQAVPDDLNATWEQRKRAEKRRSSALDGIPDMSALSRTAKVLSRAQSHGVALAEFDREPEPIASEEVGPELLALVLRARAAGVDPEQALRAEARQLEERVRAAEGNTV